MTLELTIQEGQVLSNLLNAAVKSLGLQAAQAALFFSQKIKDAETNDIAIKSLNIVPIKNEKENLSAV